MSAGDKKYDLTQGSILNKLLMVAVPIMGIQLMQMAYNLTDMFWLGRVGSGAVAASGTAGMYLWLSQALLMIGRMGAEIGVSQSLGQKDIAAARKYSQISLLLSVVLGVLFMLAMIAFSDQLIGFFNIADQQVAADSVTYLVITSLGIPATYISAVVAGTFNASGNSRVPFYANAVGLILNIIFDPLFIFNFNMGIAGAAIATILAQIIVAVLFLGAMKVIKSRPFDTFSFYIRPDYRYIKTIFNWSTPIALESMFFTLLSMVISRFVVDFGVTAMAVHRVGSQIESLSWLIGGGFSSAVTAFMGQNFGAQKWQRIHKGYHISIRAMFAWGVITTAILAFGGQFLFSLFLAEPEAVEMGVVYLRILAVCQIVACLEYNSAGCFRGIGKTIPPSVVSIVSNLIRVPLVFVLSRTSLGINGIWWGVSLGAGIRSIWMFIWFYLISVKLPKEDKQPVQS